jgi:hypothetical protein
VKRLRIKLSMNGFRCEGALRIADLDEHVTSARAMKNARLQQLCIIAARALGLDCGPMSVLEKSSIGYGSNENLLPPNPRLTFEEAGRFA